jgi:mannosyltransferase
VAFMALTATREGVGPRSSMHVERWGIAAVIVVGVLLRLFRLGVEPLWLDEAASLTLARLPLSEIWAWAPTADPANPPLYYALLHLWLWMGDTESVLRLLSVLLGVLTIPVVYLLGGSLAGRAAGVLAALLFATSPLHVWYAQDARPYTLLTLGAVLAMFGTALILRAGSRSDIGSASPLSLEMSGGSFSFNGTVGLAAYVVGMGVALLAHNSAFTLLIAANVFMAGWLLFDRQTRIRLLGRWLIAQVAVVVVWATWLPALPAQVGDVFGRFWIAPLNLREAIFTAHELYAHKTLAGPLPGSSVPLILGFGLLVGAVALLGAWSCRRDWRLLFTGAFLLVPPALLLIAGWVGRPVLIGRTLLWITVPLYLLLAIGLARLLPRRALFATALVGLLGMQALGLRNQFVLTEKESWDEAAAYVGQEVRPGDAIFFTANVVEAPFDYYFRGLMVPEHGIPVDPNPTRWEEVPVTVRDVGSIQALAGRYRRIWLVYSHEWFDDRQRLVPAALEDVGDLEARRAFRDITVFRFRVAADGTA